jgi:hypothetical protein
LHCFFFARGADFFGYGEGRLQSTLDKPYCKLFATDPAHQIRFPSMLATDVSNSSDDFVTRWVAIGVIYAFKFIYIKLQQCELLALSKHARGFLAYPLVKVAT